MHWIYLSPHLDDVALSCGGLVWEQTSAGERVDVWTICAGDPPPGPLSPFAESLHARWGTDRQTTAQRRAEDRASCRIMGASHRHLPYPDCIYRRGGADQAHLYASEEAIFGLLHPSEAGLLESLRAELERSLPAGAALVCPLALGGHADHRLTRAAAEGLGQELWYYPDYPYVLAAFDQLKALRQAGELERCFPVSESGLAEWEAAVAAYASQLSTFWSDLETMHAALRSYAQMSSGLCLWRINLAIR